MKLISEFYRAQILDLRKFLFEIEIRKLDLRISWFIKISSFLFLLVFARFSLDSYSIFFGALEKIWSFFSYNNPLLQWWSWWHTIVSLAFLSWYLIIITHGHSDALHGNQRDPRVAYAHPNTVEYTWAVWNRQCSVSVRNNFVIRLVSLGESIAMVSLIG